MEVNDQRRRRDGFVPLSDRLTTFTEYVADPNREARIKTGFANIDAVLNGGLSARLYVIASETSMGKTTLTWNIIENIARQKERHILYFSYEMSAYELMARSISRRTFEMQMNKGSKVAPLTEDEIMYSLRHITGERQTLYAEALADFKENEGQYIHVFEGANDIVFIEDCLAQWKDDHERELPPVIAIDYIQLMPPIPDKNLTLQAAPAEGNYKTSYDNNGNELYHVTESGTVKKTVREQVDYNIQKLIDFKREFHTPIIAISSFNRQNTGELDPDLAALKESGTIESSADCVMILKYDFSDNDILKIYNRASQESGRSTGKAAGWEQEKNKKELFKEKAKLFARPMVLSFLKNRGGQRGSDVKFDYFSAYNLFKSNDKTAVTSGATDAEKNWKDWIKK